MTLEIHAVRTWSARVLAEVEKAIIGKRELLTRLLAAILSSGGHVLLEDYPGLAKTLIASSFATALGLDFKRIQFTPDLLPGDITGGYVYDRNANRFVLRRGPIFAHIILADEINRASPKTQSALLEAMEERQVTVDGVTHPLPQPFMVLATQNPVEYEGTFPLPEAQLDRFFFRVSLGYPSLWDEMEMMSRQQFQHPIETLRAVISVEELLAAQEAIKSVHVSQSLREYIVRLVRRTRDHSDVYLGASPRGSLALFRGGQARAALEGRDFVLPDDIKALAVPALAHRLILAPGARLREQKPEAVVTQLLEEIPVPESAPSRR